LRARISSGDAMTPATPRNRNSIASATAMRTPVAASAENVTPIRTPSISMSILTARRRLAAPAAFPDASFFDVLTGEEAAARCLLES